MCLAVIALDAHPRYSVALAANRDEFHARPALAAQWWDTSDGVRMLSGRDVAQGGTWLGVTEHRRWAFVTNVREPGRFDPQAPSRGSLVPAFLDATFNAMDTIGPVVAAASRCNGFNLIGGVASAAAFGSNRVERPQSVAPGIAGLSNATLDTAWPKLAGAKARMSAWARDGAGLRALFDALSDRTIACDDDLPRTGIPLARERMLSAAFIIGDDYGTRCSTLFALTHDGDAHFIERSFDSSGSVSGEVEYRFRTTTR